jgi:MFS family permease
MNMTSKRWTLVVVCAATAMLMLDIAVVNTALSRIAEDLGTGLSGLQWVVDAYTLALAAVVLTAGSLADRFGRRRLFSVGLAVFTVASGACAAATDIVFLDVARAVQGVGAAVMFAVSLALLAQAFPGERERAGALAAYGATIGGTFAVGPLVGGALTSATDWQWIFLINIPIGIACLWITRTYVTESRDPRAPRVDWLGQTALSAGLFLLVLGLLRGNEQGWTSRRSSPSSRARPRCSPPSSSSRRASRSRCCRCGCSATPRSRARRPRPRRSRRRSSPPSST